MTMVATTNNQATAANDGRMRGVFAVGYYRVQALVRSLFQLSPAGLSMVAIMLVMSWSASRLGLLDVADGLIYDALTQNALYVPASEPSVLLLEPSLEEFNSTNWAAVLPKLNALGADRIVFSEQPSGASELLPLAVELGNVTLGASAAELTQGVVPNDGSVPFGITAVADPVSGVHRKQNNLFKLADGQSIASLEFVVAQAAGVVVDQSAYRLNFLSPKYLPHLSLAAIQDNQLIADLISGRTIVIGPALGHPGLGLQTPMSERDGKLSLAAWQARAIQTLLTRSDIAEMGPIVMAFTLLGLISLCMLLCRLFDFVTVVKVTLALSIGMVLVSALLLWVFQFWLPVSTLLLAQWAVLGLIHGERRYGQDLALREMLGLMLERLRPRVAPAAFYSSEEPWDKVAAIIAETLELQSFALVARNPEGVRVEVLAARGCSEESVAKKTIAFDELFTDLDRQPGGMQALKTPLLDSAGDGVQMVVPLRFGNDLPGLWLLQIDPERADSAAEIAGIISLATQIAEVLYHRDLRQVRDQGMPDVLAQFLQIKTQSNRYADFRQLYKLIQQRLDLLESVGNTMNGAFVVYDLFGQVLECNQAMENWCGEAGLKVYDLDAVEFARQLVGEQGHYFGNCLRQVVVEHCKFDLLIRNPKSNEQMYSLHLRPLFDVAPNVKADGKPSVVRGIIFELNDVDRVIERFQHRESYLLNLTEELSSALDPLAQSADLAVPETASMKAALESTRRMRELIQNDIFKDDLLVMPLDAGQVLASALLHLLPWIERKRLNVSRAPEADAVGLAMANHSGLEEILSGLLQVLIADAAESSHIDIQAKVVGRADAITLEFEFQGSGFGVPPERLKAYLATSSMADDSPLAELSRFRERVENWGGSLEGDSQLGEGIRLRLSLKAYSPRAALENSRTVASLATRAA